MEEFKTIEHGNTQYTLQRVKALDAKGVPFSAFVIFEKSYFDNINTNNVFNLAKWQNNIVYKKLGHEITVEDEREVMQFIEHYNFDLIKNQGERHIDESDL